LVTAQKGMLLERGEMTGADFTHFLSDDQPFYKSLLSGIDSRLTCVSPATNVPIAFLSKVRETRGFPSDQRHLCLTRSPLVPSFRSPLRRSRRGGPGGGAISAT